MTILLVNKFLYPRGGDATSLLFTGALLAKKGHDVFYWGMQHPANPVYPYQDYFVSHIDYERTSSLPQKCKAIGTILYSFEAKQKFTALIQKIKPDIIHLQNFAHQISPSILDVVARYNVPTVMVMCDYKMVCPVYTLLRDGVPCERCRGKRFYHCFLNRCAKRSFSKSLVSMLEMYLHHAILHIYKHIDMFIAPSVFLKNKVVEMGFTLPVAQVYHAIDYRGYTPQYSSSGKTICYFGRLSAEKGLVTLLDAMKGLDAQLIIVGDGPLKATLEEKIRAEKITTVTLAGHKTGEALKDIIRNSRFVILPSEWYENNPISVLEAFALGKPVIGARIGGIPELVIEGRTGLLFTPGDAQDLGAHIISLMRRPQDIETFGRNARSFLEENCNPERYYQQLLSVYDRAVQARARRR